MTESERFSEISRMKEARKDSQLQQKMQELRRQQIVLRMFQDQIKGSFATRTYHRKTNLDKPVDDEGKPLVEEEYSDSRESHN